MAATLERAVLSALPEAGEILIIDDASTDATQRLIWRLASQHNKVRLIETGSLVPVGVCAARNIAISLARYELIIPLDADDEFLPSGITALVQAYEPGKFVYGDWYEGEEYHNAPPAGMLAVKNITQATFLFAKEDWLAVGGYPVKYALGAEDYALTLALVTAHTRPQYIPVAVYRYHRNPSGRAAFCQRFWPSIKAMLQDDYPEIMMRQLA